jgi:enoyl-CoA hydratase
MGYETIIAERRDAVGVVTLNRPAVLNALSTRVVAELAAALGELDADPAIGAMVVTGNEKAFAAGADIKEMQDKTYPSTYVNDFLTDWERIAGLRKPLIAAVAGYALGGGCELAMTESHAAAPASKPKPALASACAGGTSAHPRHRRPRRWISPHRADDGCQPTPGPRRGVPAAELMTECWPPPTGSPAFPARGDDGRETVNRSFEGHRRGASVRAAAVPVDVRNRRPEEGMAAFIASDRRVSPMIERVFPPG